MSDRETRPSDREAIEATAAAWLAQRDDGGLSPEEQEKFVQWCEADPRHHAAIERLEAVWGSLQQLRHFRPEAVRHPDPDLLRRRRPGRQVRPALAYAIAAACLAVAAAWWLPRDRALPVEEQLVTTAREGYERVTLDDGSVLQLNAQSDARLRFSPVERRVRLIRGEAYFTVAKDPARPFVVEAGAVAVRAVGTAFNVRLAPEGIEVVVTEGRVAIDDRPDASPAAVLAASERALIPSAPAAGKAVAAPRIERLSPEALGHLLAWQEPRLVFMDTPLLEVAVQFNRRNAVQLVVADEALHALPIGGSFRADNVEAFVRLLELESEVVVDRSDPAKVVLRSAK